MKTSFVFLLIGICLVAAAYAQAASDIVGSEEWKRHQDRHILLPYLMSELRGASEKELMENAGSPALETQTRIASALLLLKEHESEEAYIAALQAFSLKMHPVQITGEWEGGMNLNKQWPVARAASFRPELMNTLIAGVLDGIYAEAPMCIVLPHYQERGTDPRPLLMEIRDLVDTPAKRELCERMLSFLHDDEEFKAGRIRNGYSRITDEEAEWALPIKGLPLGYKHPIITYTVKAPHVALPNPAPTTPEPKTAQPPSVKAAPEPKAPAPPVLATQNPAVQSPVAQQQPATKYALLWFASGFAACGILVLLIRARR